MAIELSDLTLDNLGDWPIAAKLGIIAILSILIAIAVVWFDTTSQISAFNAAKQKEADLRLEFENKQQKAVNLTAYRQQLIEMKKSFGTLLRQLPEKTEVPGLLEDISKTGLANGLEFSLFKPMPEEKKEFYAELPIQISVTGDYHQLANFVSQLAALSRIVTLHDFTIVPTVKSARVGDSPKPADASGSNNTNLLQMDITAKTYRYVEN